MKKFNEVPNRTQSSAAITVSSSNLLKPPGASRPMPPMTQSTPPTLPPLITPQSTGQTGPSQIPIPPAIPPFSGVPSEKNPDKMSIKEKMAMLGRVFGSGPPVAARVDDFSQDSGPPQTLTEPSQTSTMLPPPQPANPRPQPQVQPAQQVQPSKPPLPTPQKQEPKTPEQMPILEEEDEPNSMFTKPVSKKPSKAFDSLFAPVETKKPAVTSKRMTSEMFSFIDDEDDLTADVLMNSELAKKKLNKGLFDESPPAPKVNPKPAANEQIKPVVNELPKPVAKELPKPEVKESPKPENPLVQSNPLAKLGMLPPRPQVETEKPKADESNISKLKGLINIPLFAPGQLASKPRPPQAQEHASELSTDLEFSKPTRNRRTATIKNFEFEAGPAPSVAAPPSRKSNLSGLFNDEPDSPSVSGGFGVAPSRKSIFEEESKAPAGRKSTRNVSLFAEDDEDLFSKKQPRNQKNRKSLFVDD